MAYTEEFKLVKLTENQLTTLEEAMEVYVADRREKYQSPGELDPKNPRYAKLQVMHLRDSYDKADVTKVLHRNEDDIREMAERIHERGQKEGVWEPWENPCCGYVDVVLLEGILLGVFLFVEDKEDVEDAVLDYVRLVGRRESSNAAVYHRQHWRAHQSDEESF